MLKREDKIAVYQTGMYTFKVETVKDGVEQLKSDDDFFIYFKTVNFKPNGILEGRYLGENPKTIIDRHCKDAFYSDAHNWHFANCKQIKTARLVAVQNGTGKVIVIEY